MKVRFVLWLLMLNFLSIYSQEGKQLKYEELVRLSSAQLIAKGNIFLKKNREDTALIFYLVLFAKYNERMDKIDGYLCALSCNKSGMIYYKKGNYSKAFDAFMQGIRICERYNFRDLIPEFYKNVGNIYCTFQDFDRGNINYEKALDISTEQADIQMQIKILSNLTGMCCYAGNIKQARTYYRQMMSKYRQAGSTVLMDYFSNLDLGLIYTGEHKYDSAVSYYKASVRQAVLFRLAPQYIASSYFELAKVFEKIGHQDSALFYLNKNLGITKHNNLMDMLTETLRALTRIYAKMGNTEKEQLYKGQCLTITDSIFNLRELSRMKNSQFIYEMEQTKEQIETLNQEKTHKELKIKMQRKILFYAFAGFIVFIVMLTVVYRQNRQLKFAYKDLFRRNGEILKSEKQNRKAQLEYECELADKQKYINELIEQLQQTAVQTNDNNGQNYFEDIQFRKNRTKEIPYTGHLTCKQINVILHDINHVMENSKEFCKFDFTLERLSVLVGSNSRYVSQVINEVYNKNFRAYVNEYRIKEAQLRLMNIPVYGNYTIKAISESIGYKSHTNFIIIFKRMTGITPSLYQKMAKKENKVAI